MLICIFLLKKESKANNKYCHCPDYYKNKPENYIIDLDLNNLYRDAMSEHLPYGGFKWVKVNNKTINRVLNKSDNNLHGYFLEVDIDCLENLRDYHNDYSLALEKIKVKEEMLSPLQLKIKNKHNIKVGGINKLILNLMEKKNYVVYYRDLKYYSSQGLILRKVHRILEFKQSTSMKPYIDLILKKEKKLLMKLIKNFLNY